MMASDAQGGRMMVALLAVTLASALRPSDAGAQHLTSAAGAMGSRPGARQRSWLGGKLVVRDVKSQDAPPNTMESAIFVDGRRLFLPDEYPGQDSWWESHASTRHELRRYPLNSGDELVVLLRANDNGAAVYSFTEKAYLFRLRRDTLTYLFRAMTFDAQRINAGQVDYFRGGIRVTGDSLVLAAMWLTAGFYDEYCQEYCDAGGVSTAAYSIDAITGRVTRMSKREYHFLDTLGAADTAFARLTVREVVRQNVAGAFYGEDVDAVLDSPRADRRLARMLRGALAAQRAGGT